MFSFFIRQFRSVLRSVNCRGLPFIPLLFLFHSYTVTEDTVEHWRLLEIEALSSKVPAPGGNGELFYFLNSFIFTSVININIHILVSISCYIFYI
jgi:hypothetical protein